MVTPPQEIGTFNSPLPAFPLAATVVPLQKNGKSSALIPSRYG